MKRRQRGVALVIVLWISLLMSLLAGSYAFSVSTEIRVVAGFRERAEARALAEAAVHYVRSAVLVWSPEELPFQLNGQPFAWPFAGRAINLRVGAASGRIDINSADKTLLVLAMAYAGVPSGGADALADAILDWRDRDDARSLNGAEAPDYAAAGIHPGPKDGSFDSVDELGQVLGMTAEIVERLRPVVTVQGSRGIDPRFAPREVLLVLSGGDEALVNGLVSGDNADVSTSLPWGGYSAGTAAGPLHIDVEVPVPGGFRYRYSAVIAQKGPVAVLDWRE